MDRSTNQSSNATHIALPPFIMSNALLFTLFWQVKYALFREPSLCAMLVETCSPELTSRTGHGLPDWTFV